MTNNSSAQDEQMGSYMPELPWLKEDLQQTLTLVEHDGMRLQVLFKIESGAVGVWTFSVPTQDDGDGAMLLVHLTDDEAQSIYKRDLCIGFLEPVRKSLKDPIALVSVVDSSGETHGRPFTIPREVNEFEFNEALDGAAHTAPGYIDRLIFALNSELGLWRGKAAKSSARLEEQKSQLEKLKKRHDALRNTDGASAYRHLMHQ